MCVCVCLCVSGEGEVTDGQLKECEVMCVLCQQMLNLASSCIYRRTILDKCDSSLYLSLSSIREPALHAQVALDCYRTANKARLIYDCCRGCYG